MTDRKHSISNALFFEGLKRRGWAVRKIDNSTVISPPVNITKRQEDQDYNDAVIGAIICEEIRKTPQETYKDYLESKKQSLLGEQTCQDSSTKAVMPVQMTETPKQLESSTILPPTSTKSKTPKAKASSKDSRKTKR